MYIGETNGTRTIQEEPEDESHRLILFNTLTHIDITGNGYLQSSFFSWSYIWPTQTLTLGFSLGYRMGI